MTNLVTKRFETGLLQGLTITESTSVNFEVGRTYEECTGHSSYTVLACVEQVSIDEMGMDERFYATHMMEISIPCWRRQ